MTELLNMSCIDCSLLPCYVIIYKYPTRIPLIFVGLKPTDVDVIELHDCFSVNELLTYEALGLCPEGIVSYYACIQGRLDDESRKGISDYPLWFHFY